MTAAQAAREWQPTRGTRALPAAPPPPPSATRRSRPPRPPGAAQGRPNPTTSYGRPRVRLRRTTGRLRLPELRFRRGRACAGTADSRFAHRPLDPVQGLVEALPGRHAHHRRAEPREPAQPLARRQLHRGSPLSVVEEDFQARVAQDPLEGRALEVLLPQVSLPGRRTGAAVVGTHALAALGPEHGGPPRAFPASHLRDVLDPHRAGPPPGQVMGIRHEIPNPLSGGCDHACSRDSRQRLVLPGGSGAEYLIALASAEVPHQHQMLEVPADRREAFEVLDRLLAPGLAS